MGIWAVWCGLSEHAKRKGATMVVCKECRQKVDEVNRRGLCLSCEQFREEEQAADAQCLL